MLDAVNLSTRFKQVIQNISGSAGLELMDPSIFKESKELTTANKSGVALETKCFTETPIDSRRCVAIMTKILYLMGQGEAFTNEEKTDIFFACTRLFQSNSLHLRRMVHLLIKALHPIAEEAFVVTSSLTKDMASSNDTLRANAFRTIVRVVDAQAALQLERFLKGAVVDKNPQVASTALLCGLSLARDYPELVRRWINEVSECVTSKHPIVQFHALALLYELKKNDHLALHRIIGSLTAKVTKSPIAECLLIRYATGLLLLPGDSPLDSSLLTYLESALQHRSEIVAFEAARAFVRIALESPSKCKSDQTGSSYAPNFLGLALTTLQILLSNIKNTVRFAAMRVIYRVSQFQPKAVAPCVVDIEPLINDSCRAVVVVALITLLKVAGDSKIEKLVKQVTHVMADVSESQRVEIVQALRSLCIAQPNHARLIVQFLSTQLRDEGGLQSKTYTVNTLCYLATLMPHVHEFVLLQLCDFIEDCEYRNLCSRVLNFLVDEITKTERPVQFLRYIYNRVILESANVRATAIDALVRIGQECPTVTQDIITILDSGLVLDSEDEVRERIRLGLRTLTGKQRLEHGSGGQWDDSTVASESDLESLLETYGSPVLEFSIDAMVAEMAQHFAAGKAEQAFNLTQLPDDATHKAIQAKAELEVSAPLVEETAPGMVTALPSQPSLSHFEGIIRSLTADGENLGKLSHSTSPEYLTEKEAEYVVQVTKHFWENQDYISAEVSVRNTLERQVLENVSLKLSVSTDHRRSFSIVAQTVVDELPFDAEKSIYVLLKRLRETQAVIFPKAAFGCELSYTLKEDGDNFGCEDSYLMESLVVSPGDYVSPTRASPAEFQEYWNRLGDVNETPVKLSFGHLKGKAQAAANKIAAAFNMYQVEIPSDGGPTQRVCLCGRVVARPELVLIQALAVDSPEHGTLAKVQIRCPVPAVGDALAAVVRDQ